MYVCHRQRARMNDIIVESIENEEKKKDEEKLVNGVENLLLTLTLCMIAPWKEDVKVLQSFKDYDMDN